eukprot:SAG31_NODE_24587_length_478_cov_1.068602_2_plen_54_part_01
MAVMLMLANVLATATAATVSESDANQQLMDAVQAGEVDAVVAVLLFDSTTDVNA